MQHVDIRRLGVSLLTAAAVVFATAAHADDYPVSGKWTYDNPSAEGPAEDCGPRYMSFEGNARRTTVGGVSFFSNYKVEQVGNTQYRVTDQFDNGMISARQTYTLRLIDDDHIEINLAAGPTIALRRCA